MNCCFGRRRRRRGAEGTTTPTTPRSTQDQLSESDRSSTATPSRSLATINLTNHAYSVATRTQSYNETWAKIHPPGYEDDEEEDKEKNSDSPSRISSVLQPNRASIQKALSDIPQSNLTRLVSDYFDNSEHTGRLCLDLNEAVERARSIYEPLKRVLEVFPSNDYGRYSSAGLSRDQYDWAFDEFLKFDSSINPFPDDSSSFVETRRCLEELIRQLEQRLFKAKKRIHLYNSVKKSSALCLIGTTVGLAVLGLVIATHGLVALAMGPTAFAAFLHRPTDLGVGSRWRMKERIEQMEAAYRGTYVLKNDIDTIKSLVSRLHETVENDKASVKSSIERGRGERLGIEEVVRKMKRNPPIENQLRDLKQHICFCFTAVNRARSSLLQHINSHHHHSDQ